MLIVRQNGKEFEFCGTWSRILKELRKYEFGDKVRDNLIEHLASKDFAETIEEGLEYEIKIR